MPPLHDLFLSIEWRFIARHCLGSGLRSTLGEARMELLSSSQSHCPDWTRLRPILFAGTQNGVLAAACVTKGWQRRVGAGF